jgi:hypothetical protein
MLLPQNYDFWCLAPLSLPESHQFVPRHEAGSNGSHRLSPGHALATKLLGAYACIWSWRHKNRCSGKKTVTQKNWQQAANPFLINVQTKQDRQPHSASRHK